jgi:glucuronokinase
MNIIRKRAYARAGLLGNPSDGYNGKTISIIVRNFWAEVVLYEWDSLDIVLTEEDRAHFNSVHDLAKDVKLHGYYGGIRIIKATIKRFVEYCQTNQLALHEHNFSIRYETNIPRQVGLAGSSALITATLRCLIEFYGIEIPKEALPTLVLSVEKDELGISGGLQDRVIQVYEGLVYMDFDLQNEHVVGGLKCYKYEQLQPRLLPNLYIAYHANLSEPTEVFHNDIRERFNMGEEKVVNAMKHFADIAAKGRDALLNRNLKQLSELIDENFNTRRGIYNLAAWQIQMVEVARQCGASAKFAGSGGAIIGTYQGEEMYNELCAKLSAIGSSVIKPEIV